MERGSLVAMSRSQPWNEKRKKAGRQAKGQHKGSGTGEKENKSLSFA